MCAVAALALAGATFSSQAASDIAVDSTVVYYDVHGTTAEQLLADMQRQAKTVSKENFAQEQWGVTWQYGYDTSGPGCRVGLMRFKLIDRTVLPRWNAKGAAPALAQRWQQFMTALRVHEKGHSDHGLAAAEAARQAMRSLRAPTCEDLGKKVDKTGKDVIARYAALDTKYDADTQHGTTQGAVWPGR